MIVARQVLIARGVFSTVFAKCSVPKDRGTAVAMATWWQDVSAGPGRNVDKANMYWVPTRCQIADGLAEQLCR